MAETYESLVDLFEKSSRRFAHNELYGTKQGGLWRYITFAQFRELVEAARGALAARGIGPSDRVAIISNNRVEWAVFAHATYSRGATFVPMYESQQPDEWQFILDDAEAKAVIVASEKIYNAIQGIRSKLPRLEHVVGLHLPAEAADSYPALLAQGRANPTPPIFPAPEDVAGFIYTSGTTGVPKGVILTHRNFCTNVSAVRELFPLHNDRSLAFLPWAHSLGQTGELHTLFSLGCSSAINEDTQTLISDLAEVKPTVLVAVPRIFNRIYDGVNKQMAGKPKAIRLLFRSALASAKKKSQGQELDPLANLGLFLADKLIFSKIRQKFGGRLRLVISGGAALSPEVAQFIDALGIMVYEGYGLSETSPIVSVNYEGNRKIGSVGKAMPGIEVSLDKSVSDIADCGEIIVRGPNVMRGYHKRPDETAKVLSPDGSFRTGDLGRIDADGYIYITGRIKEQYKLETGKYVVPALVEEQIKLSPFVTNAMLYGDNKPFNVVLLVIDVDNVREWAKTQGLAELSAEQLTQHPVVIAHLERDVATRTTGYKSYERPRKVALITTDFTVENDMLTPSLKIKRRNILARYAPLLDSLYSTATPPLD